MTETAIAINYRNFPELLNNAFDQALSENGKTRDQRSDKAETGEIIVRRWNDIYDFDSKKDEGTFVERVMRTFAKLGEELNDLIKVDAADLRTSFNNACDSIVSVFQGKIMEYLIAFSDDVDKYSEKLRGDLDKWKAELQRHLTHEATNPIAFLMKQRGEAMPSERCKQAVEAHEKGLQFLEEAVEVNRLFVAGILNAYKSYLAFAKLAQEKLNEQCVKFNAEELKALIFSNRNLLSRLAKLALPIFILFDNICGIIPGKEEPYTLTAANFDLLGRDAKRSIEPKQEILEDLLEKVKKPNETKTLRIDDDSEEIKNQAMFDMIESDFISHGCIGYGMINRFFDSMDQLITKIVDMHYSS